MLPCAELNEIKTDRQTEIEREREKERERARLIIVKAIIASWRRVKRRIPRGTTKESDLLSH